MKLPYGFTHDGIGNAAIDEQKANTVRMIYRQYLTGMSLGGIAPGKMKVDTEKCLLSFLCCRIGERKGRNDEQERRTASEME